MKPRVLVIEDNQANLDLVMLLLRAFDFPVSAASDGASGLEAARRERPELVLCDVQMPGMDGFEVVERMRRDPELAMLRVVAMTAYAMVGDRERLLAAGFDGYLSKPIRPETFIDEMEALIPGVRGVEAEGRPASSKEEEEEEEEEEEAKTLPTRGLVLMVDDTAANIQLVQALLGPRGYEIAVARDIDTAERLALERRPALILCDVHVGNASGYDFLAHVRADPALQAVPFVFVSSTSLSHAAARGTALGASDFINRPIDPHEFIARVEACLEVAAP